MIRTRAPVACATTRISSVDRRPPSGAAPQPAAMPTGGTSRSMWGSGTAPWRGSARPVTRRTAPGLTRAIARAVTTACASERAGGCGRRSRSTRPQRCNVSRLVARCHPPCVTRPRPGWVRSPRLTPSRTLDTAAFPALPATPPAPVTATSRSSGPVAARSAITRRRPRPGAALATRRMSCPAPSPRPSRSRSSGARRGRARSGSSMASTIRFRARHAT